MKSSAAKSGAIHLLCDCRLNTTRIQAPYRARADIREPHRSEADPDGVTTFTRELLHNLSRGRVNSGDRKLEGCNPHRAYARARGADRLCSFGDWVAVSDMVDIPLARLLLREVSDGIIAPGYEAEALAILSQKKQGGYVILKMDSDYEPPSIQTREVFGVTLEERRNEARLDLSAFKNVVTKNARFTAAARRDALVALIILKYTQSNSVCLAADGQTIGIGAGQQSRIHCTRIACAKADLWRLRQHPATIGLPFRSGLRRPDQDNGIDLYLRDDVTETELERWKQLFEKTPARLTQEQKQQWLGDFRSAVLGSDGYIPFQDSIDRAVQSGVRWVVQPGGSNRDAEVIAACDEHEVAMAFTGIRLFHH